MDAELIQSVTGVGKQVRIALISGDSCEGLLEELTMTRLTVRQADGVPVAVALAAVAMVKPLAAAPVPATAATAATAVPAAAAAPPAQQAPAPVAAPPEPAAAPPQPTTADPGADGGAEPAADDPARAAAIAVALDTVADLPVLPVDLDIYVTPDNRNEFHRIKDSFNHAVKMNELEPRHGRVAKCYTRAGYLWNAERGNAELARLMGVFAILKDDVGSAHRYLNIAAEGGDTSAWRLMAVTAARQADHETAAYALLRFFRHAAPADDADAWQALLALLDAAAGTRAQLGELRGAPAHDAAAAAAVTAALGSAVPATTPAPRPAGAMPAPGSWPPRPAASVPGPRTARAETGVRSGHGAAEDPYLTAKNLDHRKEFERAKAAYRKAIKRGGPKQESAVKDLAWLTRRIDGPKAALRVIEEEYPGMIKPGDSLDNIMIDFLAGAHRFGEALERLDRQARRADLPSSKRYHLLYQIAYYRLADGQDSTADWQRVLDLNPENQAAQRGLALALVQRGRPGDVDHAERLVQDHVAPQADPIRQRIAALRQGADSALDADELRGMLEPNENLNSALPLVTYVVQNYSELANSTKEERERRQGRVTRGDLNTMAESARQWRATGQKENSVQAYISASVLARDLDEPNAQRYLCLGLTILADIVRDRQQQESARDLYCAALAAADDREDDEDWTRDVRTPLIGYLRSLNGRLIGAQRRGDREESTPLVAKIAKVLEEEYTRHGTQVFDLFPPLFADTGQTREVVLEALGSRPGLMEAAAAHLGVAEQARWRSVGDRWIKYRRQIERDREALRRVTIEDSALESAIARLRDVIASSPKGLHEPLERVVNGLYELRRFGREVSFEERENCLRLARGAAAEVRADIASGPTSLAVGLIEPVAVRIEGLVEEASRYLLTSQPPRPALSLPFKETSGGHMGVVTVQIKISNAPGAAPIESPELVIGDDPELVTGDEPELFRVSEPLIQIPTVVRGGEHRIELVKLPVTEHGFAVGAFSLTVTLRYRQRTGDEVAEYRRALPVRLAREEEFERIRNAFQDGATGRPVRDPNMFYGRDDLIDRIRSRLREAGSPGVGVAIFGQKRAGKSSIQHHLSQRLRELDRLPVVDVGNIGSLSPEGDDMGGTRLRALMMWRILDGAHTALHRLDPDDLHGAGPLIPPGLTKEKFLTSPEPVHDCAELIQAHRDRYQGVPPTLTVLIDEFQYIDVWIREGLLSSSFMQSFKALIERQIFHLVIVGQDALDRLIHEDPNVFGVFTKERVTYLVDAEARKLIERPIQTADGLSRYHENAVDRVVELTGGSPFYIQRFCYKLVEYMNSERVPSVTEADIEQVRGEFLDQLEGSDFDNLESPGYTNKDAPTSEEYRHVLLAVARASRNQAASYQAISAEYQGSGGRLEFLLKDLAQRDVIRHESGRYRIVVRLYQEWLLKTHGMADAPAGSTFGNAI